MRSFLLSGRPQQLLGNLNVSSSLPYNGQQMHGAFSPGRPLRQSFPSRIRGPQAGGTFGQRGGYGSHYGPGQDASQSVKPKVITVVRNGDIPRTNIKILLNRRSVQSFEQMMKDISEAFGPKWKNNKVRKLYTVKGREVHGVGDFFREDDVFIGVGNESLTISDVQDMLEELYPDSPYSKNLLKEWERARKKQQYYVYKIKEEDKENQGELFVMFLLQY